MKNLTEKKTIQALVHTAVESYAEGFKARHEAEGVLRLRRQRPAAEKSGLEQVFDRGGTTRPGQMPDHEAKGAQVAAR